MAFFEFNIAMTGLFAAQRGLQVTSNNITNANTKGYSRQEVQQKASNPLSGIGVGMTGTGVDITGVNRIRDSYIDQKLWSQNPRLGEYNIKVTQNSVIEGAFGEPSETGFTAVFNDMFNAISNLSQNPSSKDNKVLVRQEMVNFTKYYNNISGTLSNSQQNLNFDFKTTVNAINSLSTRIASLNDQIMNAELYGDEASSFRDERDNCLDELSKLINIEVEEDEYEVRGNTITKMKVKAAGQVLVDHIQSNTLEIKVRGEAERQIDSKVIDLQQAYKNGDEAKKAKLIAEISNLDKNITIKKNASGALESIEFTTIRGEKVTVFSAAAPNYPIQSAGDGKLNSQDVEGLYDVVWSSGLSFEMNDVNMSGELKAIIDTRDGCGTGSANAYCGIPYYIKRMDNYVQQFARTMNEEYSKDKDGYIQIENSQINGHDAAYMTRDDKGYMTFYDSNKNILAKQEKDASGSVIMKIFNPGGTSAGPDLSGADMNKVCNSYSTKYAMFTYTTGDKEGIPVRASELTDYSQMTANNFSISKELYDNAEDMRTVFDEKNPSDTNFMLNLLAQKDNKDMFKEGDPKDFMTAIFAELGINAKEADMYQTTQKSVVNNLTNQRLAVSQVDISEEFTYLIKYQQAYQAAAKIMTTIDGIYETTIFKLGNF